MGAFSKLFSRLRITSDPNVGTQTSAVIQADSTNSSLVLAPNGTGAIIASVPDSTATGGNARGQYAVDFQRVRSVSSQVAGGTHVAILSGTNNEINASGFSVIVGGDSNYIQSGGFSYNHIGAGQSNQIYGQWINISGGRSNLGGGNANYSTISGGQGNQVLLSSHITIGGGNANIASSQYSTISGGQSNTASSGTHATVVGGQSNTSSGQWSVTGGFSNTNSGSRGSLVVGFQNTNTEQGAFVSGQGNTNNGQYTLVSGLNNRVSQNFGAAIGTKSKSYLIGQSCIGNDFGSARGISANQGDFQSSQFNLFNQDDLLSGGTMLLNVYGYLTGTIPQVIPDGNNRMWNVQIDTIAVVTTITGTATGVSIGDAYRETKQLLFKRVGGTSSIVGTVDTTAIKNDSSLATCALTVTAGASQEMALTFTAPTFAGGGSVTMRVVSKIMLVEVAY